MNNRTLFIAFGICGALFVASKVLRGNRTSSFDPQIIRVDSAKVDHIRFVSHGEHAEEFDLKRNGNEWEAVREDMKVKAPDKSIQAMLGQLSRLTAKRIVTKDASKYQEYDITDPQASHVTVWEGKKQVADLEVGGFRFDQAARTATSFVKNANEPEVYEVDGFLSMALKARFDQFRDKKLVNVTAHDMSSIEWTGSGQNKQVIQKEDGVWNYAGMEAVDSTIFNAYLNSLETAQGSEFSELKSTSGLSLLEKVTVYGNNMVEPTVISAFSVQDTLKPFLIASSANPEAVFKSDSNGLYKRIFLDLRPFWPNGK